MNNLKKTWCSIALKPKLTECSQKPNTKDQFKLERAPHICFRKQLQKLVLSFHQIYQNLKQVQVQKTI